MKVSFRLKAVLRLNAKVISVAGSFLYGYGKGIPVAGFVFIPEEGTNECKNKRKAQRTRSLCVPCAFTV
jgi:hypothetical protein